MSSKNKSVIDGNSERLHQLTYEELKTYFHLPIHEVLLIFQTEHNVFRQKCKDLGIKRWPYRKRKNNDDIWIDGESKKKFLLNVLEYKIDNSPPKKIMSKPMDEPKQTQKNMNDQKSKINEETLEESRLPSINQLLNKINKETDEKEK
eukprot:gene10293-2710_t